MSKIKAVLLVPERDDPHGLLREGPCGARPPMAFLWRATDRWLPMSLGDETIAPRALVLAWDGKPVAEGLDRLGHHPRVTRGWAEKVVGFALGWWPDDVDALTDPDLPGTLILLDADGQEVNND